MSQRELDFGDQDPMTVIRRVIEANGGIEVVAPLIGFDDPADLTHALNRNRRRGGRIRRVIGVDAIVILIGLPGGDEIAKSFARVGNLLTVPAREPSLQERLMATEAAIEECLVGPARMGYLRARRKHEDEIVAAAELARKVAK